MKGKIQMKNVNENEIKKCIFKLIDNFERNVRNAFNGKVDVVINLEGIYFKKLSTNELINERVIYRILSRYYDVSEITSIHVDDCDYTGVWICYK